MYNAVKHAFVAVVVSLDLSKHAYLSQWYKKCEYCSNFYIFVIQCFQTGATVQLFGKVVRIIFSVFVRNACSQPFGRKGNTCCVPTGTVLGVKMLKKRNAFTLYELIIAIALLAVVAGVVLSFVSFMSDYTSTNELTVEQNNQTLAIRREVDRWFSYFDSSDAVVSVDSADANVIAAATYQGNTYYIRFVETEGRRRMEFTYPQQVGNATAEASEVSAAEIVTDGTTLPNAMGDSVRFAINCIVTGKQFVCQLVFK